MSRNIRKSPVEMDYCDANDDGGAVHRCLHAIMHLIEDHAVARKSPCPVCGGKAR